VATCRIGFVGAGGVAARHAGMLSGFDDVRLVAVTDPDRQRAESLAGSHRMRVVPDVDALLAEGLDAVYVCVPPFAHGPAERAVAAAGLALFVEKPLGLDEQVATGIADALDAAAGGSTGAPGHRRLAGQGAAGGLVGDPRALRRPDRRAGGARARPGQAARR
jgi:predicted dehydrogenase